MKLQAPHFFLLQDQIWDISSDEEGTSKVKQHVPPGLTVDMIINALKQLDLSKFLGLNIHSQVQSCEVVWWIPLIVIIYVCATHGEDTTDIMKD